MYGDDPACAALADLCKAIDPRADEDVYARERKRHVKKLEAWSFAGGFPRGVHDPPRRKGAQFVLQMGSKNDLMWGDCGAVYLLHNPRRRRFSFEVQSC